MEKRLIKDGDIILDGTAPRYEKEAQAFKKLEQLEQDGEDLHLADLHQFLQSLEPNTLFRMLPFGEAQIIDNFVCTFRDNKTHRVHKDVQYDETQLKKHPRRNRQQNKKVQEMLHHLDLMFGENNAGFFLAMILDGLNKMMKEETPSEYLNLRTIEIKFNDFYSIKLDCDTGEYIK